jgi:SNF family Na+-dependent transporter
VSFINIGTAIFAGFAIFSILGFLAHSMGFDDVGQVVSSGPGLSFIIFPEAILLMPGPQVWAILFFFMMLVLGLGSTFAGVQMMVATVIDWWPSLRPKTWLVTACVCSFCFLCGLPMTMHGGILIFTLFEWHTASWAILMIGALEVILFAWVYGLSNTFGLISEMGMKIWRVIMWYWKSVWLVITPIGCIAIFIFVLTGIQPLSFRGENFPLWADIVGWMIGTSTIICFPIFAIYKLITIENKRDLLKPTENWGPQEVDGVPVDRS